MVEKGTKSAMYHVIHGYVKANKKNMKERLWYK